MLLINVFDAGAFAAAAVASLADNLLALLFQVYFSDVETVAQISPNFLFIAEKSILKEFR
jgi:hypothetical protein